MSQPITRNVYAGSTEYLSVTVSASIVLNTQTVQLSFDGVTWLAATWQGSAGYERKARVLLNSGNSPAAPATRRVFVKIDDGTEIPIFKAEGQVVFQPLT